MSIKPFYITTPIYYVNDKPHIGHAYTTLLADVMARYQRLLGHPTFFLTGTDEHGEKVLLASRKNKITPQEQCDQTVVRFQQLWQKLGITHDDFLRTTQKRHTRVVQKILQDLYERDEIYRGSYEGWYCVPDERFFTEKDLDEGNCPLCGRAVERIVENNYFFRMSKYQDWLVTYIQEHPEFIQPDFRRNETLGFLRRPLNDLCISRPKSRLPWGIDLPFDSDYVCYVWFDALVNYISAIGYGADEDLFKQWWPPAYHLIGKDILTTHTVYWPTMLRAMGLPMPQTIFAHGWWLVGRNKMGKSLGNVVDPMQMCERYGIDPFRYHLLAEMSPGNDCSFTEAAFVDRYNQDLAGGIGNTLNRVVKLAQPNFSGALPGPGRLEAPDIELRDITLGTVKTLAKAIETMRPDRGLEGVLFAIRSCNRYFEQTQPWKLAKSGHLERLGTVLYTAAETLRVVSGLLHPVMPEKMQKLRRALGMADAEIQPQLERLAEWNVLTPGTPLPELSESLFPRAEPPKPALSASGTEQKQKTKAEKKKKEKKMSQAETETRANVIEYDDFAKLDLRVARIVTAEKVEKADKLLRLELEVGGETRQIVAGIAPYYDAETLPGRLIVIVANLKPRKLRGLMSNGMLLAATGADTLRLVTIDGEIETGASVG